LAIDWLKQASQKAVAKQLRLSWDEINAIMERAVELGLVRRQAEEIPYLGVVNDLSGSRVLYVAQDREQRVWTDSGPRSRKNKEMELPRWPWICGIRM
jgi:hypothetical protein